MSAEARSLNYALNVSRRGWTTAELNSLVRLARSEGVTFSASSNRGNIWANQLPTGPRMLKTVGYVCELKESPGTYRVRLVLDARKSDVALLAELAGLQQQRGLPGFGGFRRGDPDRDRYFHTSSGGYRFVWCARALDDYHHRELAGVIGVPDFVPEDLMALENS